MIHEPDARSSSVRDQLPGLAACVGRLRKHKPRRRGDPGARASCPQRAAGPRLSTRKERSRTRTRSVHRAEPASEGYVRDRTAGAPDIPGQDLMAESPETCPTRTPASGDNRPVPQRASWRSATDEQRREWLRSGIVPLDYPEPVAADWPDLLAIVEERVKPERMKPSTARSDATTGGDTGTANPHLYSSIGRLKQVLATIKSRAAGRFCLLDPPVWSTHDVAGRLPTGDTYLRFLLPPVPPSRNLGTIPRIVAGRPTPLHPLRLLRDLPVPRRMEHASRS